MKPRLSPLSETVSGPAVPQLEELIRFVGYRPNALLTMARRPGLLVPLLGLVQAAMRAEGNLAIELRFLIACEACRGARCFYSAAHAVHAAHHVGIAWDKLAALDRHDASPLFSEPERAALAIARAGATLPVGPADQAFASAAGVFSEDQQIEIVSVVALFGWFNRWNGLMRTALEETPAEALRHVPWLVRLRDGT